VASKVETTLHQLVVAGDSRPALVDAVAKAAIIEHYTGAAVSVALVIYDPIVEEGTEWFAAEDTKRIVDNVKETERRALETAVAPWRDHIADLEVEVCFERDTAAAIVSVARAKQADLILKPITRSSHLTDFLHAPPDWQIMRDAPCPVLFTRPRAWSKPVRVLAALDVTDTDHIALNHEILRQAALLAAVLDGELHVVTVYPSLGQQPSQLQVAHDFEGIKRDMRERRRSSLAALLTEIGVTAHQLHVVEGRPRLVIARLAAELDAGLTVLGTAARKGLQKLLIGNTAEGIVSDLPTDLLTVREFERAA
jgi:universal stress protein E